MCHFSFSVTWTILVCGFAAKRNKDIVTTLLGHFLSRSALASSGRLPTGVKSKAFASCVSYVWCRGGWLCASAGTPARAGPAWPPRWSRTPSWARSCPASPGPSRLPRPPWTGGRSGPRARRRTAPRCSHGGIGPGTPHRLLWSSQWGSVGEEDWTRS